MSVGPLGGIAANVAGTPLAQKGSDVERTHHDASAQQRLVRNVERAEAAAGVGETDGENHETNERDADGRRLWEETPGKGNQPADTAASTAPTQTHLSRDASGQSGTRLDLNG
jgi:hypothetical protein